MQNLQNLALVIDEDIIEGQLVTVRISGREAEKDRVSRRINHKKKFLWREVLDVWRGIRPCGIGLKDAGLKRHSQRKTQYD
jgi:hypothetical protein